MATSLTSSFALAVQAAKGRLPSDLRYGRGKAGEAVAEVLATAPLSIAKQLTY